MANPPRIGVLAVQGDFREHAAMLRELGADVVEVRKPAELEGLDGLVVPGGESTTFMRLMRLYGLDDALARFSGPIFGTCAGMIVLDRNHLGLADVEVERNAYGRQTSSFEADLELDGETTPLRGVFIRAPRVRDVGPGIEVLAELDGEPVLVRDGRVLAASFHPELTGDPRVHELFLELVEEASSPRLHGAPPAKEASERRAGQYSNTDKRRECRIVRPAASGGGGAGLRPADAVIVQGGEDVGSL